MNHASKMKQSSHPPSFVCPLSYRVMEEPLSDLCGHNFERQAIEAWIARGNTCCPISRKTMSSNDLKPNHLLAERIDKWKWEQEHEDVIVLKSATHHNTLSDEEVDDQEFDDDSDLNDVIIREDGDIEMQGHVLPKTGYRKNYHEVPTGMTLLPQEREALQVMRQRNNLLKKRRDRLKCLHCSCALFITLIFVAVMGTYWVYYRME